MLRTWGRLLRLSLLPSAAADIAAGWTLGALGSWPGGAQPFLLILASLGVYHGNLALNDWADREHDARTRPERPIPSGAIPAGAALSVALGLQITGIALAFTLRWELGVWMACVSGLAAAYDLCGRGAWLGPTLLGLCRAGNLGAGILGGALATEDPVSFATGAAAASLYGGYVFFVSRLGRLEDGEDAEPLGNRPSVLLYGALTMLAAVPLCSLLDNRFPSPRSSPGFWLAALAVLDLGWRMRDQWNRWTRPMVVRAMGAALRRLLIVTATVALVGASAQAPDLVGNPASWPAGVWVACAILAGYPVSYALRGVFPPS